MLEVSVFEKQNLSDDERKFVNLHNKTYQNGLYASLYLYEFSRNLLEMQESKLYLSAGFATFEEYTQSCLNIKKSHAYNYIKIAKTYSPEFFELVGKDIEMSKLLLLSQLGEEEAFNYVENNNIENQTVKELKSKIEELRGQIELKNSGIESMQKELKQKEKEVCSLSDDYDELLSSSQELNQELISKEKEIEELTKKLASDNDTQVKEIIKEIKIEDTSRIQELEQTIVSLENNIESLSSKLEESEKNGDSLKDLEKEIETLKDDKETMLSEMESLKRKLSLASNDDFNKFKVMIQYASASLKDIRNFIFELLDKEFQEKCIQAYNTLLKGNMYDDEK